MKHLKSNSAYNPQGIGPLFDSVKPNKTHPITELIERHEQNGMFDGVTYEPKFDATRLRGEMWRVYMLMQDKQWRTLSEISHILAYPEASISARLRDFRKAKFGSHTVERRRRGDPKRGLFEYRLLGMSG